jgi:hypothetical protein
MRIDGWTRADKSLLLSSNHHSSRKVQLERLGWVAAGVS